jgi:methylglutaconyl-CoA hydratase
MNYIQYTKENHVGTIVLNRPEKRNALNDEVVSELMSAFTVAEEDADVKIVVLKGAGESFCAGADLGYLQALQNFSREENLKDSEHLKALFHQIHTLKKVVIAQVEGDAIAGGCGLVTCCDFVFSTPTAKFGYTEVRIGFIPAIVTVFLLRKVAPGKARELLLTGNLISADEALSMGLINRIFNATSIQAEVSAFAKKLIMSNSVNSMLLTKQMLADVPSMGLSDALRYACEMNADARASADCKKGIAAFLNKEKIEW